jgi:hypothetical protein
VRLFVNKENRFSNATLEAGDTNAVITLGARSESFGEEPRRRSLTGTPLPDLATLGLAPDALAAGQPALLCLLDCEQRPSRRILRQLSEQYDALKQKGVSIAVAQAVLLSDEAWQGLKESVAAPFPVGRVKEKSPKSRWATEANSLPWLILVGKDRRIAAEGFAFDELDAKLKALGK